MNLNFPDKYLDNIVNMLTEIGKKEIDCTFSKIDVDDYGTVDIEFEYNGDCSNLEELSKIISKTQEECKYPFNTLQERVNSLSAKIEELSNIPEMDIPDHWRPIVKDMIKEIDSYMHTTLGQIYIDKVLNINSKLVVVYHFTPYSYDFYTREQNKEMIDKIICKYKNKLWEIDNND